MRSAFFPGRGDGDITGSELVAELDRPDPTGDRPPAPGQDRAEEQEGEPWCGATIQGSGRLCEPLARGWVADARMSWPAPSGMIGGLGNRHRPGRAGPRLPNAGPVVEADRMVELPESVRPRFVEAGWHPGRRSPVSPAAPIDHPAAKILAEFGGLTADPPEEGGPYGITSRELWPDESISRVWAGLLSTRLIGIAALDDAHGELYAADGRIFGRSCMHDAFWLEGDSFFVAVERSLSGGRPRPLLRPDQSSVTLDGIRFTDDSPEVYRYRSLPG